MRKYGYLIVEGKHDVEFAYRVLSEFKFKRADKVSELDSFMTRLVPQEPTKLEKKELQKRADIPLFLFNESHFLAIHSASGDSRLVETIEENSIRIDLNKMTGIGLLIDADYQKTAISRYKDLIKQLAVHNHIFPSSPGTVSTGEPRYGAFVLPDNQNMGNLEDILIECADNAFPNLLKSAKSHVDVAKEDNTFTDNKREDLNSISKYNKAVVGSIATTLRPGRAVQNSIQDNIWVRGNNLMLPRVKAVRDFLVDLFEL